MTGRGAIRGSCRVALTGVHKTPRGVQANGRGGPRGVLPDYSGPFHS